MSDSVTPWTAARQASLSFTISRSLLRFVSVESMMLDRIVQTKYKSRLDIYIYSKANCVKFQIERNMKAINPDFGQKMKTIPTTPDWLSPCHKLNG